MLKKLLSIVLTVMLVSSIGVVAGAENTSETTQKTVWVENFDSIDPAHLANASATSTSPLWFLSAECTEHQEYSSRERGHYHLNDGWTMQAKGFTSSYIGDGYGAYNAWKLAGGDMYVKKSSDQHLYTNVNLRAKSINLKNNFDGNPVDLTTGKAVGFSFDWYNASIQLNNANKNLLRDVIVTATLASDTDETKYTDVELKLGTIYHSDFYPAVGSSVSAFRESWHNFVVLISKDTVKVQASSYTDPVSFEIADYDPNANTWAQANNSGYYIESIKSVELHLKDNTQNTSNIYNALDNLKTWIAAEMPGTVAAKEMPIFANFTSIAISMKPGNWTQLKDKGQGNVSNYIQEVGTGTSWTNIFDVGVYTDSADTTKTDGGNGWFKMSTKNPDTQPEYYDATYNIGVDFNGSLGASVGDKVQFSTDFKIIGDADADSEKTWFFVAANFANGAGTVLSVAADGTVIGTDIKLKQNEYYSLDVLFELEEAATVATVYINGVPVLTKNVNGEQSTIRSNKPSVYMSCKAVPASDRTRILSNVCYIDNIGYRVFEDGEGVYNFDKFLTNASNKVIAAAEADFVNNVIAPVSEDWTVADFNALGLTNAAVVAADGTTVVTEGTALLKDNKIKFTGDYGKDTLYTVSKEGATTLSKDHLVIVKQGSAIAPNGNVSTASAVSAKAYNTSGALTVITAEYEGGKLVAAKVGADYTPTASGNKIKVFTLKDMNTLVPTASHTEFNVVQ